MEDALKDVLERLMAMKGECTFHLFNDLEASGVTMTQLNYLRIVDQLKATTISELSEKMDITKPTVTESVKKLEKYDLICKRKCQSDARKYYIELTERGEQLAHLEQLSINRMVEKLKDKLSEQDIMTLISVLEGISETHEDRKDRERR